MGVEKQTTIKGNLFWEYSIEPFDTLSAICLRFGYSNWMEIYMDAANTLFRDKFPNPNKIDFNPKISFYIPVKSFSTGKPIRIYQKDAQPFSAEINLFAPGQGLPYSHDEILFVEDLIKLVAQDGRANGWSVPEANLQFLGWETVINDIPFSIPQQNVFFQVPDQPDTDIINIPAYLSDLDGARSRIIVPAFKGIAASRYFPKVLAPRMPGTNFRINFNTHGTMGGAIFTDIPTNSGMKRIYFSLDLAGKTHPTVKGLGQASQLPHWNIKGQKMQSWSGIGNDHVVLGGQPGQGYHVWRPGSNTAKAIPIVFKYVKYGQKILVVVAIASDSYDLSSAIIQDTQTGNYRTTTTTSARIAGGWIVGFAGAWVGMKGGALAGAAITSETGPGALIGAAVGAIIGGLIFGIGGALGAEWAAENAYDALH